MLTGESSTYSGGLHLLQRQAGQCAACKAVFDPDLEQGGNINIMVCRDPATGDPRRDELDHAPQDRRIGVPPSLPTGSKR
jgi:hypothetical protein